MTRALLRPAEAALGAVLCAVLLLAGGAARAIGPGDAVDDVELPALSGGRAHLVAPGAAVQLLVFVKPNHPHCLEALQSLAAREGAPGVRWLAILPSDASPVDAKALAAAAGVKMPFAFDPGDRLYAKLQVKLHPTIVVLDRQRRIAAVEPYRAINFGDRVTARIRFTLGEIGPAELAQAIDPAASNDDSTDGGIARRHTQFAAKLLTMGQLDPALGEVNKGLALAPDALAYHLQGKILRRLGRCEEAARAVAVALRMDPKIGDVVTAENSPCPPPKERAQ